MTNFELLGLDEETYGGDPLVAALAAEAPSAFVALQEMGISAERAQETLADVGRKHVLYGIGSVESWARGLLAGDVVSVGRLQVERTAGPKGHDLHIPEMGPLTPALVDEALREAARLTGSTRFCCTSWLLDPRLQTGLPGTNIAAFGARFTIVGSPTPDPEASSEAARFVFRRPLAEVLDPALVAPRSRLEHLVASTLRSGEQWTMPLGVLEVAA